MGLFPQQFIEDLRAQANILTVIQEYVPLKRAGTSYKGNCPFHNEKTPSFHVHPDKGFFHCFGCHAGGDVFKFLELHEKVAFPEAVRMLAQKFGVGALIDKESKRYAELGLAHARYSDERWLERLSEEPLLLRQPLVRHQHQLTIGTAEETWKAWISK